MAASPCSAAAAAAAAAVWRGNGMGGSVKQGLLASTGKYDPLVASKTRSGSVRSVKGQLSGRQRWEWSARPCAVAMESTTSDEEATETKKKIAKLFVEKIRTVPLPTFSDAAGSPQHLRAFLREPEGRQCMLNTKALRKFEDLGDGAFKCYLPMMEFLSFEVAPVLELMVDAREDSCQVDLLSCRFEGSDVIRGQNERFAASMRNHLSWSSLEHEEQELLHVRVELDVSLEVYTLPFTVLPIAAVESPGTLILQALVDRLLPVFVEQLFVDYQTWAESRTATGNSTG